VSALKFTRKVAAIENVSLSKAQKILLTKDFSEVFAEELEMVYDLVQAAIDGEVDEVQLLGGGSRFSFLVDFIRGIVGYTDVLKDLPALDSMVLGTAHVLQAALNESRYKLVPVVKPPVFTTSVECGEVIKPYCKHRGTCADHIVLETANCSAVRITASEKETPEGVGVALGIYKFKNLSDFKHTHPLSSFLIMHRPAPVIASSMWCETGQRRCETIAVEPEKWVDLEYAQKEEFVEAVVQGESDRAKKAEFRARMVEVIDRVGVTLDAELLGFLERAQAIVDQREDLPVPDMRQFLIRLEKKAKAEGIEL
jgi:hypothetical protein